MWSLVITWAADLIFMTAIWHFDGNHFGQKARCTIEPSWIALFPLVKIFPNALFNIVLRLKLKRDNVKWQFVLDRRGPQTVRKDFCVESAKKGNSFWPKSCFKIPKREGTDWLTRVAKRPILNCTSCTIFEKTSRYHSWFFQHVMITPPRDWHPSRIVLKNYPNQSRIATFTTARSCFG